MTAAALEDVWRREWPHVLAALLHRHGDLGDCEDAAQEAAEAAAVQWGRDGTPDNPRAWLIRVAGRKLIDAQRSTRSRAGREEAVAAAQPTDRFVAPAADESPRSPDDDDTLRLMFLCCHPALTRPSQVALTLHAVAGLSTEQIAAAYLVPVRTMTQRLTRARSALREAGARFELPSDADLPDRVNAVVDVCHLMFTEGHTRTGGDALLNVSLTTEAIRLTRQLHRILPNHDDIAGALALLLLTAARSAARTDADGDLIPLAEQDRSLWDRDAIAEGVALLERVLPRGHVGRFQLQAAIAAVHAEAPSWKETDWLQISVLYGMLDQIAPSPAVTLNRAVAVGMTLGPSDALVMVDALIAGPMRRHHRAYAVRAHLLEQVGDPNAAVEAYRAAARLTRSLPEQRYLNAQLRRLGAATPDPGALG